MKTALVLLTTFWSLSALAELTTQLTVSQVRNSKSNQYATNADPVVTCQQFKGTYQGNSVVLKPQASGGSGRYTHRIVWQLSESYKTFDLTRQQKEAAIRDGRTYRLDLPELKDDVPYLQQSVFLITEDLQTGKRATSQLMFTVSRPAILAHTKDPEKLAQSCYQVFPAFESVSGILSNGSTNPSQLIIRHGIQNLWTRSNGNQFGYYVSPLAWTVLGNIFSFYRNYFSEFSKQTIETVEVSNGYSVAPGDFIQLYEQTTRYVTPFDVFEVDSCGKSVQVEGTYFMQWWGRAYHAVPINPYDESPVPRESIGISPINNCPEELTPEFARDYSDYVFARTN